MPRHFQDRRAIRLTHTGALRRAEQGLCQAKAIQKIIGGNGHPPKDALQNLSAGNEPER